MLRGILGGSIERVKGFDGMRIDATVWNQAHDFHLYQQMLHNLGFHGSGIASGLEVFAQSPPGRSLIISPGVAIDQRGYLIILSKKEIYPLTTKRKGRVYVNIQFTEVPAEASGSSEGRPFRFRQAYRIQESQNPPSELEMELARVELAGEKEPFTDALDPSHPGANEIDLRFRSYAGGHIRGGISLGQISWEGEGEALHTDGLLNLVDHINNQTSYRADFSGQVSLKGDLSDLNFLYFSGDRSFQLTAEEQKALAKFLDQGGYLFGNGCPNIPKNEFGFAFDDLAIKLKRGLSQLKPGHPILKTHYPFSSPPQVSGEARPMMIGEGLLYCDADYGCAWSGEGTKVGISREEIRSTLEFGANVLIYGYRHWYRHQVIRD